MRERRSRVTRAVRFDISKFWTLFLKLVRAKEKKKEARHTTPALPTSEVALYSMQHTVSIIVQRKHARGPSRNLRFAKSIFLFNSTISIFYLLKFVRLFFFVENTGHSHCPVETLKPYRTERRNTKLSAKIPDVRQP